MGHELYKPLQTDMDPLIQLGDSYNSLGEKYQPEKFEDGVRGNACASKRRETFPRKFILKHMWS